MYNKQLLDEVYCDMKIINVEVRVISRAEGKDDNSYRDHSIANGQNRATQQCNMCPWCLCTGCHQPVQGFYWPENAIDWLRKC